MGAHVIMACRSKQRGEEALQARLLERHHDAVTLRLQVQDQGIGVTPEAQARLFQQFHQTDDSMTRHHGGMGLGLALSQRLAALMASRIELDSTPGAGSTFGLTLRLPLASAIGTPAAGDAGDDTRDGAAAGTESADTAAGPDAAPAPPTQEQLDTAHYLLALLHDSDAQALMLWEQSQHALAPLLGPQLASLRAALAAYDFDEAAQLLQRGLSTPAQNG